MTEQSSYLKQFAPADIPDELPANQELERPVLGEADYKAFGRPLNKPGYSRHLIEADGSVRSLAYSQLDNRSLYRPGRITLRFVRLKVTEVEISGRNLYQLYDYIHSHRMPWVKIAARDFAADGEPVVTQIVIRDEPEKLGVK